MAFLSPNWFCFGFDLMNIGMAYLRWGKLVYYLIQASFRVWFNCILSLCQDVGLFTISADEKIQFRIDFKVNLLGL